MHVLLSDVFKQFCLRKTDFLETYQKSKFLEKKILRNSLDLKSKKGSRYIWKKLSFGITIFSCLSSTKPSLRFFLNCFVQEIKGYYQSSLGNEFDFGNIMIVFPNILAKD